MDFIMKKRKLCLLVSFWLCLTMMVSGCKSNASSTSMASSKSSVSSEATTETISESNEQQQKINALEKEFSDKEKTAASFKDDDTSDEASAAIEQAIEAGTKLLDAYNEQSKSSKNDKSISTKLSDDSDETTNSISDKTNELQKKLSTLKERKTACDANKAAETTAPETSQKPENQDSSSNNANTSEENQSMKPAQPASKPANNTQTQKTSKCTPYTINHPAETHQEPTYTTVHHDEQGHNETVVDTPAYDEQVASGDVLICNFCKQQFATMEELENHSDLVHDAAASYTIVPQFKTVHHDAVTHQQWVVDQPAYDEKVQTGTKTVIDKEAWAEQGCK